ncbi:rodlin [Streptomyces sp. NPDC005408]|uniref:rodlin n=1 Tax=Streptomyces sp. NPDC005408 TaxID=3155341 RepID=UPI0033B5FADD
MIKKILATAAVTASMVGVGASMAPQALAIGNDEVTSVSGEGASQIYGNSATHGDFSPQIGLIQGSLNKPCIGLPIKGDVGSVVGVVPITVQDLITSQQNQQCTENSTQVKGDDPLSHILDNIPIASGNGSTGS